MSPARALPSLHVRRVKSLPPHKCAQVRITANDRSRPVLSRPNRSCVLSLAAPCAEPFPFSLLQLPVRAAQLDFLPQHVAHEGG
jgi:hypothetical protein